MIEMMAEQWKTQASVSFDQSHGYPFDTRVIARVPIRLPVVAWGPLPITTALKQWVEAVALEHGYSQ